MFSMNLYFQTKTCLETWCQRYMLPDIKNKKKFWLQTIQTPDNQWTFGFYSLKEFRVLSFDASLVRFQEKFFKWPFFWKSDLMKLLSFGLTFLLTLDGIRGIFLKCLFFWEIRPQRHFWVAVIYRNLRELYFDISLDRFEEKF